MPVPAETGLAHPGGPEKDPLVAALLVAINAGEWGAVRHLTAALEARKDPPSEKAGNVIDMSKRRKR